MNEQSNKKSYPRAMHTAEHLLGGTMVRRFGCGRTVSTHLERKKSKADFDFRGVGRGLSAEEVGEIEWAVNEQIGRGLVVTYRTVSYAEAVGEGFDLGRLPEGEETSTVRIVSVGDYDRCPCIGEHVATTTEIGRFRVISTDYDPASGLLRIRFKLDTAAE